MGIGYNVTTMGSFVFYKNLWRDNLDFSLQANTNIQAVYFRDIRGNVNLTFTKQYPLPADLVSPEHVETAYKDVELMFRG